MLRVLDGKGNLDDEIADCTMGASWLLRQNCCTMSIVWLCQNNVLCLVTVRV